MKTEKKALTFFANFHQKFFRHFFFLTWDVRYKTFYVINKLACLLLSVTSTLVYYLWAVFQLRHINGSTRVRLQILD